MAALAVALEAIVRLLAVACGVWLAYTEATGTYEYYIIQQHGDFNYIVKSAVGISLGSVLLPYFVHRKLKQREYGIAALTLVGFILSVGVVFNAAVSRTSSVADLEESTRKQQERKLDAAKANVRDAEKAQDTDKLLVAGECKTGVGKECKALARESKGTLQKTIDLRTALANTKEPKKNSTPERLSRMTGGVVSADQIQMFEPLLVPVSVSFLAGLFITLGLDKEHKRPEPKPRRWPWRRELAVPQPTIDESASNTIEGEIVDSDPGTFLATCLSPGESVREEDVCHAYELWCVTRGCTPIPRPQFKSAFVLLCKHSGFRRSRGKVYGMQLAKPRSAARVGKMLTVVGRKA